MKIKLAILDKDVNYLHRIVAAFNTRFADRLVLYSFTDLDAAFNSLETEKIDIFIASEDFLIDITKLPSKCGFAYSVESASIESLYEQRTICKYQKLELIYKEILGIYAEISSKTTQFKLDSNSSVSVLTFMPASGGVGSSTIAASCAFAFAKKGKRVLYLNLEQIGSSTLFFQAEGQYDLNDIIYTIKSKRSNLALKLESSVKQDTAGVSFYDSPEMALDIIELTDADIKQLLTELKVAASYDYIIIDADFSFDKKNLEIMKASSKITLVSDGSEISNHKLKRLITALTILDENNDFSLLQRIALIFNKFSSKTGLVDNAEIKVLGGAPKFDGANTKQLMELIAAKDIFDGLL